MKALTTDQIKTLFNKYNEILKLETLEFGCKPTEVRHLIGRLGEFYCALETNGTLAYEVNQHGFDVVSDGKRISVKTTAQKVGFITISKNTLSRVDELMVIQYLDGAFTTLFYGDVNHAVENSRVWKDSFELDISRAIKIQV